MFKCTLHFLLCLFTGNIAFGQSDSMASPQTTVRQIITSDGVDLYVTVKGKGTPCLYIHGGPGSGSWWLEKFSGNMLEKHFQMVYLDQRGTARSSSPKDGNYSMDRMVRDFEEVRAALGIDRWITMGHSFGGILQMGYAQIHPEVIDGMIMINCSLNSRESMREAIPKACELLGIKDTEESTSPMERLQSLYRELNEKDLFWKMGYASLENKQMMAASFDDIPNWNHDLENAAMAVKDYWEDFSKAAPAMNMPVLFFYGRSDWMVGPEHYRQVHFPNMLLFGSNVGHVPFLENKADLDKAITSYRGKYHL